MSLTRIQVQNVGGWERNRIMGIGRLLRKASVSKLLDLDHIATKTDELDGQTDDGCIGNWRAEGA